MKTKLLFPFMLLLVVLVAGCTSSTNTLQTQNSQAQQITTSRYFPATIDTFSSAEEGDLIRFYFTLIDSGGANTPADGHVSFRILDNLNKTVYSKEFDVLASQFVDYQFKLTGQGIGKAYEWRISKNDITKGASSYGTATISFASSGKTMTAEDTYVKIPAYTQDELKYIAEEEYQKSSTPVNQVKSLGNFNVTLQRVGFYDYSTSYSTQKFFRVDVSVENTGQNTDSLSTYDAVMVQGKSQYDRSYSSELDASSLRPGVIREGYLLFEKVPSNISGAVRIDIGSSTLVSDYNYLNIRYSFSVNLTNLTT